MFSDVSLNNSFPGSILVTLHTEKENFLKFSELPRGMKNKKKQSKMLKVLLRLKNRRGKKTIEMNVDSSMNEEGQKQKGQIHSLIPGSGIKRKADLLLV